jgi:hypothetical protein
MREPLSTHTGEASRPLSNVNCVETLRDIKDKNVAIPRAIDNFHGNAGTIRGETRIAIVGGVPQRAQDRASSIGPYKPRRRSLD